MITDDRRRAAKTTMTTKRLCLVQDSKRLPTDRGAPGSLGSLGSLASSGSAALAEAASAGRAVLPDFLSIGEMGTLCATRAD
ncbi:hypothetical protein [Spongiactinospora sp. 9N601]|uniref:hypothetical protein n=1 Tax=Spongiactinospora sp. 9N601 TaxID=3375149 RepID=UPI0037B15A16